MRDPVLCVGDGMSYERKAIESWFAEHSTSPSTNISLEENLKVLVPNIALRKAIESELNKHQIH